MAFSIEIITDNLKSGKSLLIINEENDKAALFMLADKANASNIEEFTETSGNTVQLAVTGRMAEELGFNPALSQQSCTLQNAEAGQKAAFIEKLLNPGEHMAASLAASPFDIIAAAEGGVLKSQGFAEAAVDLAKLAGAVPVGLIAVFGADQLKQLANSYEERTVTLKELADYRKGHEIHIVREIETVLPSAFGDFRIVGYSNDLDTKEHIAIVKGDVSDGEPVMVRIHSECFTGDIFGSERCDCGPQLHAALAKIEKEGRGVVVYMRQEGRGIGLLNKLRAYKLQDEGRDTHEANLELGFKADAREYHLSAQILHDLGVQEVELLTNNPDKIAELEKYNVHVKKRIPLQTGLNSNNMHYMETKLHKFGHMLDLHS